jgi:hypothetical protein
MKAESSAGAVSIFWQYFLSIFKVKGMDLQTVNMGQSGLLLVFVKTGERSQLI